MQPLASLQSIALPATHWPLPQTSPWVHTFLSSQAIPLAAGEVAHVPVAGLHAVTRQGVSGDDVHFTTVTGSTLHANDVVDLSQNTEPLHLSASLAQSALLLH